MVVKTSTVVPSWQRGIPLARLREFGGLFKDAHKHLVFGAFGLTKERDVAEYLARACTVWVGEPPRAVALFTILQRDSEQRDFCGRAFTIERGSFLVKSFVAKDVVSGVEVLQKLAQRVTQPDLSVRTTSVVWLELFEEDEVAKAAATRAGFLYVATKISAGSEIKGVYVRGVEPPLAPLPLVEEATLLALEPEFLSAAEHAAVSAEVSKFEGHFGQHYSNYNKRKSWTAFALRGYSDDPGFIIKPAEMSRAWKEAHAALLSAHPRWTNAARGFPTTRKMIERLGLSFDRVRFMRLRSRDGELSRHADITDREAGVADGCVVRLHVPITTSGAVTFFGWTVRGERIERKFPERSMFYLDARKPHKVINTDKTLDRVHLVVDVKSGNKLRKLIADAVAKK